VTRVRSTTSVPKADITIHGAVRSVCVPCLSSSPRLGVGGGRPKPRKSSAVMAEIAETIVMSAFGTLVVLLTLVTFVGEAIRESFDPKKFTLYK